MIVASLGLLAACTSLASKVPHALNSFLEPIISRCALELKAASVQPGYWVNCVHRLLNPELGSAVHGWRSRWLQLRLLLAVHWWAAHSPRPYKGCYNAHRWLLSDLMVPGTTQQLLHQQASPAWKLMPTCAMHAI